MSDFNLGRFGMFPLRSYTGTHSRLHLMSIFNSALWMSYLIRSALSDLTTNLLRSFNDTSAWRGADVVFVQDDHKQLKESESKDTQFKLQQRARRRRSDHLSDRSCCFRWRPSRGETCHPQPGKHSLGSHLTQQTGCAAIVTGSRWLWRHRNDHRRTKTCFVLVRVHRMISKLCSFWQLWRCNLKWLNLPESPSSGSWLSEVLRQEATSCCF